MIREKEKRLRRLQEEMRKLGAQCDKQDDELLKAEETEVKAAACEPAHHCQALIAVCQDCGLHHPVVADACLLQDKTYPMPITDGTVKGKPAKVLRDTGCSTVVVRRSFISDEKLTGQEERCVLIDGTIRRTPVAKIDVE